VLQDTEGNIVWQSNTSMSSNNRYKLQLEDDGYLLIINANGTSIWNSSSSSSLPTYGISLNIKSFFSTLSVDKIY